MGGSKLLIKTQTTDAGAVLKTSVCIRPGVADGIEQHIVIKEYPSGSVEALGWASLKLSRVRRGENKISDARGQPTMGCGPA